MTQQAINDHFLGVIIVQQFSLKAGIAKFGDRAKTVVTKELTQLHDMKTYVLVNPDEMTLKQRQEALNLLIFLTKNAMGALHHKPAQMGAPKEDNQGIQKKTLPHPHYQQRQFSLPLR